MSKFLRKNKILINKYLIRQTDKIKFFFKKEIKIYKYYLILKIYFYYYLFFFIIFYFMFNITEINSWSFFFYFIGFGMISEVLRFLKNKIKAKLLKIILKIKNNKKK